MVVDKKDKPKKDIKLESAHIFVDAITDRREEMINAEKERKLKEKESEKSKVRYFVCFNL